MCDGEEYVNFDPEEQVGRSSWIIDTKYIAAITKKQWGANRRWAYQVVGLRPDLFAVQQLQTSRHTANTPIDLAGDDEIPVPRSHSKRKASSPASSKPSSNPKRTKQPPSTPSGSSSAHVDTDDDDNDHDSDNDDDNAANSDSDSDSDNGNDEDDEDFIVSDDSDSDAHSDDISDDNDANSDSDALIDPADDSD